MAAKRVKKKTSFFNDLNSTKLILNSVIGVLILVILMFVYSLYDNHIRIEANQAAYTGSYLEEIPTALLTSQEKKKAEVDMIVQVLNGCAVPGIAAQFQGILSEKGIDVIDVGNAPNQQYDNSTIYFYGENLKKAFRLADMLGIAKSRIFEKEYSSLGNDLTLVLGKDYTKLDKLQVSKEEMRMQILNGCGVNGISRRYSLWFEGRGYAVVDVRNADNFKYHQTLIEYDNAALSDEIRQMQDVLGLNDTQVKKVADLGRANVSVILGRDYAWLNPYPELRDR